MSESYRLGIDENGLGSWLGPMTVTAVCASVTEPGETRLRRKLSPRLAADLDDSKKLVSFGNHGLGEAWARALYPEATNPEELLVRLSRVAPDALQGRCPEGSVAQCWSIREPSFQAQPEVVARLRKHLATWEKHGIRVIAATTEIVCASQLNTERTQGSNRFTSDLHAMERLILHTREQVTGKLVAYCGKVGGMGDYSRFFGPLSGRLHAVIRQERAHSAYHFPGIGDLHFVQDADASDPLVMLASLIGKYVRELLMGQINAFYKSQLPDLRVCSGYNDPVSRQFVTDTQRLRKRLRIAPSCFERD